MLPDNVVDHVHTEPLYTTDDCCSMKESPKSATTDSSNPEDLNIMEFESPELTKFDEEANMATMINHNTCASFMLGSDLDLFETSILATSTIEDFGSIINLDRQTLG